MMDWPCLSLLTPMKELKVAGTILTRRSAEKCPSATEHAYGIVQGVIILTEWRGRLHEVIYQTPLEDDVARASRMAVLFEHYGDGHTWREILDNGFGKTYRRSDDQRFALWSYCMDFQTFGTMEYHAVMWG